MGKISFTYIGNAPKEFTFRNSSVVAPLSGIDLGEALREHHVYVTGSRNEPGSMHQVEGMMCGLPVVFRDSGALPEYCEGFGEIFNGPEDVEEALQRMFENYAKWRGKIDQVSLSSDNMALGHYKLFQDLTRERTTSSNTVSLLKKAIGYFGGFVFR
jgi:glycosyltransferase involved in cell wall biosynthesis